MKNDIENGKRVVTMAVRPTIYSDIFFLDPEPNYFFFLEFLLENIITLFLVTSLTWHVYDLTQ